MQELEHEHTKTAIARRLAEENKPNYVRDWVYGGIDGAVTTFAIVAGVVGADLSSKVIVILGLANVVADGISMAASNYSGTKSEVDDVARLREIEKKHIALVPEGEREELRQIMAAKGLKGKALEEAVDAFSSDEEQWVNTMLTEEYGLSTTMRDPMKSALSTFAAFFLCGMIPLIPFVLSMPAAFTIATILTGGVFFAIGSLKSLWSLSPWWHSGAETLGIGLFAAGTAYYIGYALNGLM